ncbi:MAG: hypothetical protein WAM44_17455, partial [Chthoniobacterales bacterium]
MRIGILSIAHLHAEGYQANLRAIPGVELVGFSHENSGEGQAFSQKFNVSWFPTHRELLAQELDGVVI